MMQTQMSPYKEVVIQTVRLTPQKNTMAAIRCQVHHDEEEKK